MDSEFSSVQSLNSNFISNNHLESSQVGYGKHCDDTTETGDTFLAHIELLRV